MSKYLNNSAPYYQADEYNVYIDINRIQNFSDITFNKITGKIHIGAGVSINQVIASLQENQLYNNNSTVNHHSIFSVSQR